MHEHEFQGQKLRHDHAGSEQLHGYFEHPEDGARLGSTTPVADALALVDAAQGNDIESERRLAWVRAAGMSATAREMVALRELAEAVRVHLAKRPEQGNREKGRHMATWFEVTYTGEPTDADRECAADLVKQGFTSGQLLNESDEDES